jgi:Bacterial membrane protein YfhO
VELKSSGTPEKARGPGFAAMLVLLLFTLSLLFHGVFVPGHTLFSNDGPLARLIATSHKLPERFTGCWYDLNSVGFREPGAMPDVSYGLLLLLKPVAFSKFYVIVALTVLGLGAWCFFRQCGLAPPACILGGFAAVLNSEFFSDACWGTAGHCIGIGMTFFALAALADNTSPRRWLRVILAGLAVGLAVAEGADVGAIFSLYVAAFTLYWAWLQPGSRAANVAAGTGRVALVAVCAALVSAQTISELVATNVIDVTTPRSNAHSPEERWDWATQWSLPKQETLSLVVPGIFGFRTDSPDGAYYWGTIGRDPLWLHYDANGRQGSKPDGFPRYTGGGFYAGVTVVAIALWAALQALRRKRSVFGLTERRFLWFWMAMGAVALLFAYGRYAPFYSIVYRLPYFSTIRNPVKFLDVVSFSIVILFGFGVDSLWRRYMAAPVAGTAGLRPAGLSGWLRTADVFERNWVVGCLITLGLSLFAWLIYFLNLDNVQEYMVHVQVRESLAQSMAAFSVRQVGWFVLFFVLVAGLMFLVLSRRFAGKGARRGAILLGVVLVVDLGRADLPWIIFWDYQTKYESNPIVDSFRDQPWEHRVADFPLRPPPAFQPFERLYRLIWIQQLFPYYNIQSADFVQMSRMPDDLANYVAAFKPNSISDAARLGRFWQLTNTRYLLGAAAIPEFIAKSVGPDAPILKVVTRFNLVPKPGGALTLAMDQMTAVPDTNGIYAVMEYTSALPRAKLYPNWQVDTNDSESLALIVSPDFDPAHNVLVAGGVPAAPPGAGTNQDSGTVDITSYAPKDVKLKSNARTPTVLLLNDRYEASWKVTVDGQPKPTLRCNYLMRGVYLEPGAHNIEFKYQPPFHALYVSLVALGVGAVLLGVVLAAEYLAPSTVTMVSPTPGPATTPAPRPQPATTPKPAEPAAPKATELAPTGSKNKKRVKSRR